MLSYIETPVHESISYLDTFSLYLQYLICLQCAKCGKSADATELLLQEEDANQLYHVQPFNPRNGEFTCPLCRQLGNSVLPVVPSHIIPDGKTSSKVSHGVLCLGLVDLTTSSRAFSTKILV